MDKFIKLELFQYIIDPTSIEIRLDQIARPQFPISGDKSHKQSVLTSDRAGFIEFISIMSLCDAIDRDRRWREA